MKKSRFLIIFSAVLIVLSISAIVFLALLAAYYKKNVNVEYDESLFTSEVGKSSTVFYANSSLESDEYIPVKIDVYGASKKIYYKLDEISEYLIDGFVAVEDRGFYSHSGVDIKRTILAAIKYISGDKDTFGASTITQQLIKNISGDNEISLRRKISEILRAYSIEKNHTKSEIIEVYLNIIPMGNGLYGVGAASEFYFGKSPLELTPEEAATLIGITNAPSAYDPYVNSEKCIQKRNRILSVMCSQGIISYDEMIKCSETPLNLISKKRGEVDSWFIETVLSDVVNDYARKNKISESMARILLLSGGYSVYTTMDLKVQNIMEKVLSNTDYLSEEVESGLNYSMIVIDSRNGNIMGIVGGAGKKDGNRLLNRATIPITPASTLKPIALYAPLIDSGEISWATVFDDVPQEFTSVGDSYSEYPRNSPNRYDGLTTIKDAVRYSKNTIAVKLCRLRGVEAVYRTLTEDYEFETLVERDVDDSGGVVTDKAISPLALGQLTNGISLRSITEAYTVFPRYGNKIKSRSYLYVTDKEGKVVLEKAEYVKSIFSSNTGKVMNQLLSEVVKSGTAKSISLGKVVAVAGKTGTSGNNKDKIFIGYTPTLVAGIWCGYNDGRSIQGVNPSHLDIWDKIMSEIENECAFDVGKEFDTSGLIYAPYCMDSGKGYSQNCLYDPRGCRMEYGYFLPEDSSFEETCDTHVVVNYDTKNKGVAIIRDDNVEYAKVSLIKNENRSFPKEIYITDAEYVYRDVNPGNLVSDDLPYFYGELKNGEYVGISNKKRQFNRLASPK